ncbi:MAG: ribonuclease R [Ruminococcaceae bacterium]|nr:ribonuclease R [Oscillospiraceae bacterium]
MKKKDFDKFTKRNVHKRRSKEAARRELLRAVSELGVKYDGVKIGSALDMDGRGGSRRSTRKDEILTRGIFRGSKSAFGFVSLEEGDSDIFIPASYVNGALDGDFVEISYRKYSDYDGKEKTEGRVKKVIEYGRKTLIGTLYERRIRHGRRNMRELYLEPDDQRIMLRPVVIDAGAAELGDKVEVLLRRSGGYLTSEVVRVFGDTESLGANYEAILAECEIITDFTPDELSLADELSHEKISLEGRVDRRDEIIFTIDGEGAKDLDDAVSLRRLPGGKWRLGVHIADVSHYVRERTPLDRCVMSRGTSVYFTDKVVPMLPRALSNGACSLNAGEEKYTLSAIIDLDTEGKILETRLEETVIVSRVRGVYSEVNRLFSGEADADLKKKYKDVLPTLRKMQELYGVLLEKSKKRGAIDFDADEAEIILDERGVPTDIIKRVRGASERMIEQFMLTANEAVATYLTERAIPCVYRIHEQPPVEHFESFLSYAESLGLDTRGISLDKPTPKELSALLLRAEEKGIATAVSYSMLRAMAKAKYSEKNEGHFGLGIEKYCHFTSPIRRLSDLATHRIIKKVLFEGKRAEQYSSYARRAAAAATEGELRAISAERKIEDLYKVIYMSERVGEEFYAVVSSITQFGIFCMLDNTCEGLVPISEMPGVFTFDERNITLRSRYEIYHVADRVKIKLEEANMQRGKLRFSIIEKID